MNNVYVVVNAAYGKGYGIKTREYLCPKAFKTLKEAKKYLVILNNPKYVIWRLSLN